MALEAYRRLVVQVDDVAEPLFRRYRPHLQCRRGCYFCCANLTILPVEHFNLATWLARQGRPVPAHPGVERKWPAQDRSREGLLPVATGERDSSCPLLGGEGECTVYPARPLICRVHGVPLAYPVFEYDQNGKLVNDAERMDLWCDLNFTGISDEGAAAYFDENGRVDMAAIDRELEKINEDFLLSEEGAPYADLGRLTMENLAGTAT